MDVSYFGFPNFAVGGALIQSDIAASHGWLPQRKPETKGRSDGKNSADSRSGGIARDGHFTSSVLEGFVSVLA
jgi:hypothetical protein